MNSRIRTRGTMVAALVAASAAAWSLLQAQFELATDFTGGEQVESITVRVEVGADGDELNEPVALDLGLGFPLWLSPIGRVAGETVPFGAIAQTATSDGPIPPGTDATFTFEVAADAGQDRLRTTSQLLAGVEVSDIGRIGFASLGNTNWNLAGYEIQVNGRVFASHAGVDRAVQRAHEAARLRQAELELTVAPLETEQADLESLVETGLATADDEERLRDIRATLAPMRAERERLAAQLEGRYPWFEETEFTSPWRTDEPVGAARITLVTDSHPGADTHNVVYFRTGGHKYALSGFEHPLTGEAGPQTFQLDLIAGPLVAADLRGYAVGMLGHSGLNGETPDRWHPRRVLVEIDGRVVYDSEESDVDRLSLDAVRVIPPAHLSGDGGTVINTPIARETFVWHAGSGVGLDLVSGGAAPLPPADDPAYPDPEAGLEPAAPDVNIDIDLTLGVPLFPGEFGPGWGPGGWGPGAWVPGGWGPGLPWWPPGMLPPGWGDWMWWFPGMWDPLVGNLLADLFDDIIPFFDPFQVDDVQITAGWREGQVFTVTWDVTGNAAEVADFTVQLLPIHPHDDPPLAGLPLAVALHVPAGARSWDLALPITGDPHLNVMPVVTAWPAHPAMEHDSTTGPVRPVFPFLTPPGSQPLPAATYDWASGGIPGGPSPIHFGLPPMLGRAAWYFAGEPGHIDLDFGNAAPGYNIAFRPLPGDDVLGTSFSGGAVNGTYRVVANVGFLEGTDAHNAATFHMVAMLTSGGMFHFYGPVDLPVAVAPGPPTPMPLLYVDVDSADVGGGPAELTVVVFVEGGALDFIHAPAFFGLRAIPH